MLSKEILLIIPIVKFFIRHSKQHTHLKNLKNILKALYRTVLTYRIED